MRMDRLTLRAQDILNSAQNIATERDSYEIQPEHMLKALIEQDGGIFTSVAQKLGAAAEIVTLPAGADCFSQQKSLPEAVRWACQ